MALTYTIRDLGPDALADIVAVYGSVKVIQAVVPDGRAIETMTLRECQILALALSAAALPMERLIDGLSAKANCLHDAEAHMGRGLEAAITAVIKKHQRPGGCLNPV